MSLKLVRAAGLCLVPMALGAVVPRLVLAQATGTVRGRVVESGSQRPIPDAQVSVVGSTQGGVTGATGEFVITNVPVGDRRLRARRIGFQAAEQAVAVTAGATARAEFTLSTAAAQLDQVVVTALGQQAQQRTLGVAQQTVRGAEIAETQRPNFVNALQGRIAGVDVTSSSGVPGASASITIRGVSSISGSNQPLFIIDGVPMDNKTTSTAVFASDAPGSTTAFNNRGVDFTNRAADVNPDDIESVTVLKGPEASALYGIDAANGAVVITTKRGRPGTGGLEYSNNFRVERVRDRPEVQREFGPTTLSGQLLGSFFYFGAPYAAGTQFFDNVDGFFQTGMQQTHNLSFSGAAPDNRVNYRVSSSFLNQEGVVQTSQFRRVNVNGTSSGQVTPWLRADLSMIYANTDNDQPNKGANGPLLGLLVWPGTDDASDWLTPAGQRRRITSLTGANEIDNPVLPDPEEPEQREHQPHHRQPGAGGDAVLVREPEDERQRRQLRDAERARPAPGERPRHQQQRDPRRGRRDHANINLQSLLNFTERPLFGGLSISGTLGTQVRDDRSSFDGLAGQDFLDPNFVSINNTNRRFNLTTLSQRRLMSAFGSAQLNLRDYLYVTVQGRNDWTSTIPRNANSFFYPSVTSSFVVSDAFPALKSVVTSLKLRGAYAEVGQDARPYADRPALQFKSTAHGGYGYGFTGPNPNLKPEFRRSAEGGSSSPSWTTASASTRRTTARAATTRSSTTSAAATARASSCST
jgi:TonB-dependent SusC/RagA subfamily outer membrane receptor